MPVYVWVTDDNMAAHACYDVLTYEANIMLGVGRSYWYPGFYTTGLIGGKAIVYSGADYAVPVPNPVLARGLHCFRAIIATAEERRWCACSTIGVPPLPL